MKKYNVLLLVGEIIGYAAIATGVTITILLLQTIYSNWKQ